MQVIENPSLEQIRVWLAASDEVSFHAEGRAQNAECRMQNGRMGRMGQPWSEPQN
jgi:hypothetical protein